MLLLKALILGIVQGLTEFIPVSSSGHLILSQHLLDFDGGLGFDVALHIGTLVALLIFFRKDFWELGMALVRKSEKTRLAWILILSLVPAVLAGVALQSTAETVFRSDQLVAINLIVVALIMLLADKLGSLKLGMKDMTPMRGLGIGAAQAIALIPGVSRSGITIVAGLFEGFDRVTATRFSFLLSAPIIAGAILKVLIKPSNLAQLQGDIGVFIVGILASLVSGYLAIKFLLNYLNKHGLAAFAYYRIAVGVLILMMGAKL